MQHITEQLKLLELANVIYANSRMNYFEFREREYILKFLKIGQISEFDSQNMIWIRPK